MRVLISGATGFIGSALYHYLTDAGHECIALARDVAHAHKLGLSNACTWNCGLPQVDAVVNLAGENVVGLWTEHKRAAILNSRIETTRRLVDWMQEAPPKVFLSASAIGYYGHRPRETLTEQSLPDPQKRFRFVVCNAWEHEANRAKDFGTRVVNLRLGNVLHPSGGYLEKMIWLFKHEFCFGIGNPQAMLSWIALEDALKLIEFTIHTSGIEGPLNITAPHPVTTRQFSSYLAAKTGRKVWGHIPSILCRTILGEFASAIVEDQNVLPARALEHGFVFSRENLSSLNI